MKRPSGNLWIDTFFARKTTGMVPDQNLTGKTVVFTGGTDGMGRVALERLAAMGADVVLVARNPQKTAQVVADLRTRGHSGAFTTVTCDLTVLESVRQAATEIVKTCEKIDLLINCAGGNISERQLSPEGFELNLVVNYLGPFLLTELLLGRVKTTPGARIVNLTSATQQYGHLDLDDLHREKNWSTFSTYAQAKLCMIMHAEDIAKRLTGSSATINCLNPGYIRTNLTRNMKGPELLFIKAFGRLAAPAWVGGERIVAVALGEQYKGVSGEFIYEDTIMPPNPETLEAEKVQKLLNLSFEMTGLKRPQE